MVCKIFKKMFRFFALIFLFKSISADFEYVYDDVTDVLKQSIDDSSRYWAEERKRDYFEHSNNPISEQQVYKEFLGIDSTDFHPNRAKVDSEIGQKLEFQSLMKPKSYNPNSLSFILIGLAFLSVVMILTAFAYYIYKSRRGSEDNSKNSYNEVPIYGVTGPAKNCKNGSLKSSDLSTSDTNNMSTIKGISMKVQSQSDSDEEVSNGHYTVYECPGLASTEDMVVKNPMFQNQSVENDLKEDSNID